MGVIKNIFKLMLFIELVIFDQKCEYIEYYKKKAAEYDNLCRDMKKSHCLM